MLKRESEECGEEGVQQRFFDMSLYMNRELSWIAFNQRVL